MTASNHKARPELLAPAGDLERLRMAIAYGADAVYLGGREFGMRAAAGNFDAAQLQTAAALCRAAGVRMYITCNTIPHGDTIARLPAFFEVLDALGADGVIVADVGVLALARRHAPRVPIHISTQAGVTNHEAARVWYDLGAARVIPARELSLAELADLRANMPRELELEAFVHGAMCVSFSGRCVISNYMTGRDANQGACAQPCRYRYALMEEKRPGEYFPVFENESGTYLFNSRDMCMIDHVAALVGAGVGSFKIEGRAKSAYYTAVVTAAYRHAIDAHASGLPLDPVWRAEVDKVSHRPYSTGFYFGYPGQETKSTQYIRTCRVAAVVVECDAHGFARLSLRNKFKAGDTLELLGPGIASVPFEVPVMLDAAGQALHEPRNPQMEFFMQLPRTVAPLSMLRMAL